MSNTVIWSWANTRQLVDERPMLQVAPSTFLILTISTFNII